MGDLSKQAVINAPVESVFKFVADPRNAPSYISSISRILSGPEGTPTLGQAWQAEANFLGRQVNVTLRLAQLVEPRLVRFVLEGEPEAIMTLLLEQGDNSAQSRVSLTLDVPSVPKILLSSFMSMLLTADMDRLKRMMET